VDRTPAGFSFESYLFALGPCVGRGLGVGLQFKLTWHQVVVGGGKSFEIGCNISFDMKLDICVCYNVFRVF